MVTCAAFGFDYIIQSKKQFSSREDTSFYQLPADEFLSRPNSNFPKEANTGTLWLDFFWEKFEGIIFCHA